jgi:hypothetical protein
MLWVGVMGFFTLMKWSAMSQFLALGFHQQKCLRNAFVLQQQSSMEQYMPWGGLMEKIISGVWSGLIHVKAFGPKSLQWEVNEEVCQQLSSMGNCERNLYFDFMSSSFVISTGFGLLNSSLANARTKGFFFGYFFLLCE